MMCGCLRDSAAVLRRLLSDKKDVSLHLGLRRVESADARRGEGELRGCEPRRCIFLVERPTVQRRKKDMLL